MSEHQIHVWIRIILAVVFFSGLTGLFSYLSRRAVKALSAGAKKAGKLRFMNFDEPRLRRANNRRSGRGKVTRKNRRN